MNNRHRNHRPRSQDCPGSDAFETIRKLISACPLQVTEEELEAPDGLGPAFDVRETRDAIMVQADLPGLRREDVEIRLYADRLVIAGKREPDPLMDDATYYALERTFGPFRRAFSLPCGVDSSAWSASVQDGVLTVSLPKYVPPVNRPSPHSSH